jgi:hypothetical protein
LPSTCGPRAEAGLLQKCRTDLLFDEACSRFTSAFAVCRIGVSGDFEQATTDVGDIRADTRDIAKLLFIDFVLLQGNDWFVLPLEQPVGLRAGSTSLWCIMSLAS